MKNPIDINKLVCMRLEEKNHSKAWLARQIYVAPSSIGKTLRGKRFDVGFIISISIVLEYDFLKLYSEFVQKEIQEKIRKKELEDRRLYNIEDMF